MTTTRITLAIEGLGYGGGGALTIEGALSHVPGVARATVNPATEMAYVEYNPTATTPAQLMQAVAQVGFQARELGPPPAPAGVSAPDTASCCEPALATPGRVRGGHPVGLAGRWGFGPRLAVFVAVAMAILGTALWLVRP